MFPSACLITRAASHGACVRDTFLGIPGLIDRVTLPVLSCVRMFMRVHLCMHALSCYFRMLMITSSKFLEPSIGALFYTSRYSTRTTRTRTRRCVPCCAWARTHAPVGAARTDPHTTTTITTATSLRNSRWCLPERKGEREGGRQTGVRQQREALDSFRKRQSVLNCVLHVV